MSRLIATQLSVKDLQDVSKTDTEPSEHAGKVSINPKASLNFRGMEILFLYVIPVISEVCVYS